jgi:predicted outer membrane repeat protein
MWGNIEAHDCLFRNNTAIGATHNTGGAIFSDRGSVLLRGCQFDANIANASGGALFAWSAHGSCKNVTVSGKRTQSCQNITIM